MVIGFESYPKTVLKNLHIAWTALATIYTNMWARARAHTHTYTCTYKSTDYILYLWVFSIMHEGEREMLHFYHIYTRFTTCDKSVLIDLVDTSVTWLHIFATVMYSSIPFFKLQTPWKEILLSRPMWMNILAQWGNIWGLFTLITQAPTYFKLIHGWDIQMVSNIQSVTHISDS